MITIVTEEPLKIALFGLKMKEVKSGNVTNPSSYRNKMNKKIP